MTSKHMSGKLKNKRNQYIILFSVVILAIAADVFINSLMVQKFQNEQRIFVMQELGTLRARMEEQVNTSFSLIFGMAAAISSHPEFSGNRFDNLAKILLKQSDVLKNIAAAPDFVIRYIYPPEKNEKALGLDYRRVPDQWTQALAAKKTGKLILAGPLKLVQGGWGVIARIPVFRDDNGEFWGLVSAVMDFRVLLANAGITSQYRMLELAIRGKDGKGSEGDIIWGDPALFNERRKAVNLSVSIPSGSWQIAAVPEKGWAHRAPQRWRIHFIVFSFTLLVIGILIQYKQSQLKIIESENQLKAMVRSTHDALVMIDSDGTITLWNPAAEVMFGYTEAEMIGKKFHDIVVLPKDMELAKAGLKHFETTGYGSVLNSTLEMTAVRKSGEVFPVERSVASFKLGGKWCAAGSMRDITARKEYEKKLTELATTDALTGLPNRRHFLELSGKELKKTARYQNMLSLLMFDIDHFKKINDTYGHDGGDMVLRTVADEMRKVFRETDILGRLGGEEFAVTMPETDLVSAGQAAERFRSAMMAARIKAGIHPITLTVSVGVVDVRKDTNDISQMIKKADDLLYEAKRSGRNKVVTAVEIT